MAKSSHVRTGVTAVVAVFVTVVRAYTVELKLEDELEIPEAIVEFV